MKRVFIILISLLMIFTMTACDKESEKVEDGGYKVNHPETSPLIDERGDLEEFEITVMDDDYDYFHFEKDAKTGTYKLSHQHNSEYEEKVLSENEILSVNGMLKTGGLLDLNGYEVWVSGLSPDAGYVQCGGRFDSGNSFYFEGNGGHIPDTFQKNYREMKKLLTGFFKQDSSIDYDPTLTVFKQQIFDSGYIVGCGKIITIEGPFGDGLRSLIDDSDFADLGFLYDINFDHYVEVDGQDLYCVVPLNMSAAVAVSNMNGDILYSSATGDPIFIMCNGFNVYVSVVDGDKSVTFMPYPTEGNNVFHCFN